MIVKPVNYASSTARLYPNYAQIMLVFKNSATFFQYYAARQKMGKTVRKVSFITLLHYYHSSPGLVCCFYGFKCTLSSNVSSFGSLQDLKVLELYFRGGGHHLVTLSRL